MSESLDVSFLWSLRSCPWGRETCSWCCTDYGGVVLHRGDVPEDAYRWRTLTATMPVYLKIVGRRRSSRCNGQWAWQSVMRQKWVNCTLGWGLSVGSNLAKSPAEKERSLLCDITYSNELRSGFIYLSDNMVVRAENMVQRPLTMP